MKIIYVDGISSISNGYFSFKFKNKIIKESPFICKEKHETGGSSAYHFDKSDLKKIHYRFLNIDEYSPGNGLMRDEYTAEMKRGFEQIIRDGSFVNLLSELYRIPIENTEIRWYSKDSVPGEPVWINVDLPLKSCTFHSDPNCTYANKKQNTPYKGIEIIRRDGGWLPFEDMAAAVQFCRDQYPHFKRIDHC